jgi:hypothetical protein
MRVVLDTNIMVSALLIQSGHPAAIYRAWQEGYFTLLEHFCYWCKRGSWTEGGHSAETRGPQQARLAGVERMAAHSQPLQLTVIAKMLSFAPRSLTSCGPRCAKPMIAARIKPHRAGRLQHFHFWCIQRNQCRRGFSSRKDALRCTYLCRVEVKMLWSPAEGPR